MSRKTISTLIVLTLAFTLLAGCSSSTPAPSAQPKPADSNQPVQGGTAVFQLGGDPETFNPLYGNSGTSLPPIEMIYNPLVWGGENWGSELKGDLAESWKLSDDGLVWTINLRKNVKWHDGQPFTAEDVVFTMNAVQNKDLNTEFHEGLMVNGKPIKFEAVDANTVKATLPEKFAPFWSHMSIPIIAKHVYEGEKDLQKSPKNAKPIGTGPFKFVSYKNGEQVALEANPDFYRGKPYLDKLVFRIVPSPDSALVALQSGDLNFIGGLAWKDASKFQNDKNNTLVAKTRDHLMYLSVNHTRPVLAQKEVRQALAFALDRKAMTTAMLLGYGEPADSVFTQMPFSYKKGDTSIPRYDYSKDKAKELLGKAGFKDSNNDGIVDKDGKPLKLEVITFPNYVSLLPIIQAQLKDVGIDCTTRQLDTSAFTSATDKMEYDLAISGMAYFGRDPAAYSNMWAVSKDKQRQRWESTKVIELFQKGATTSEEKDRIPFYKEAEKIMMDELPVIPLLYSQALVGYSNKLVLDQAVIDVNRLPQVAFPEKIWMKK